MSEARKSVSVSGIVILMVSLGVFDRVTRALEPWLGYYPALVAGLLVFFFLDKSLRWGVARISGKHERTRRANGDRE